jgi:hypothetical protein
MIGNPSAGAILPSRIFWSGTYLVFNEKRGYINIMRKGVRSSVKKQ